MEGAHPTPVLAGSVRRRHDVHMGGAIVIIIVLVVAIPVTVCMSGAIAAAILGFFLKSNAEKDHQGSELIELNN